MHASRPACLFGAALLLAGTAALAVDKPAVTAQHSRPAAFELNWTPLRMPTGERSALLGGSYMVALTDDWGVGPAAYGAAQGAYGGLFTVGLNLQRRWRLGQDWHAAASLYAGAGGGVSSERVRAGGGLMLRPELSLRRHVGDWYLGLGVAQVKFPSGNIGDTNWALTLGRSDRFVSFSPTAAGERGRSGERIGMGFDEIALFAGIDKPRAGASISRGGQVLSARQGRAGAELRHYLAPGSWWGVEAAGAASGGVDGYMEILGNAGQDWPLFGERLRLGAQLAIGLGGGGDIDTGPGWLARVGPSLRWITPWGPTLRLDASLTKTFKGRYKASQLRLALALPLGATGGRVGETPVGTVREQAVFLSLPRYEGFAFKDGSREAVTGLGLRMTRGLAGPWYGTAQAGSAAFGKAGAFSYGLFGLGAQSPLLAGGWRVGAEALVGAAGGGGVRVGGGGVAQTELWAQWQGDGDLDRLRLRAGVGRWQALGGGRPASSLVNLSIGWAYGTLGS